MPVIMGVTRTMRSADVIWKNTPASSSPEMRMTDGSDAEEVPAMSLTMPGRNLATASWTRTATTITALIAIAVRPSMTRGLERSAPNEPSRNSPTRMGRSGTMPGRAAVVCPT